MECGPNKLVKSTSDSMGIQTVFPSCTNPYRWKYDVFLSFRGEDTRKNFTDHLYAALNQKGIHVFKDDKELKRGKPISPELLQAIEESRLLIIVFSRNYASSPWCLDELVEIVECMKTRGQTVFPVFYNVDPSVVRKQIGDFEKAFAKHEETFKENIETVCAWRNALKEVANLSGWNAKDRHESEFIQEIAMEISSKLGVSTCMSLKDLVGMDSRLEKLKTIIDAGYNNVRMIGVFGMGGIGKTTIARAAYELISCEFEGSSFVANVREISEKDGLFSLQKILLSQILDMKDNDIKIYNDYDGMSMIRSRLRCKKVLIVIDDVDDLEQLNKLVGGHDWFGSGSRIIITSRVKSLLTSYGIDEVYEVEKLNSDEAFKMFISKAFKKHQPSEKFRELSKCVVKYAGGLPLALEILGSFLSRKEVHVWEDAIKRLNRDSKKEILDRLQISYDGLEVSEKRIFLDIACFFKGKDIYYVTKILESCGFFPDIGIDVLIDKSLITIIHNNKLWMHDLLQEMGRQIVKRESIEEPGKRSRLWEEADVCHVLVENTGTELIEGIMLEKEVHLTISAKAFSKMINLRLLEIHNFQLPEGLDYLSNKLQLLKWHGYPLRCLPSSWQSEKIVELQMHYCHIEQLWKGIKPLNKLAYISLKDCQNLREIPDLTWAPNLEKLFLNGCPMLQRIHSPLIVHRKLMYLEVSNCTNLATLPSKIDMESLEKLEISRCPKVKKFPELGETMKRLKCLCIDGTAIRVMPLSIEVLVGLEELILTNNINLVTLPSPINSLKSLKILDLSGCSRLENVLETLAQVESLEVLDLSGTAITQPVQSIFLMKNLKVLSFRGCKASTSKSWGSHLLSSLVPRKPLNSVALMLPTLSDLCSLTRLDISDCNLGEGVIPGDFFASLCSLERLNISRNNFVSLPASMNCLQKLEILFANDCKRLQSFPELPSNLSRLDVNGCASLEIPSTALKSYKLKTLFFYCINCFNLLESNNSLFLMLKDFLKGAQNRRDKFSMVIPGSEIPEWLRHQSEGSSVTIERPPDLDNNKLVAYVVCSVFVVNKHLPVLYSNDHFGTHKLFCSVEIDGSNQYLGHLIHFNQKFGHSLSEHLWILYFYPEVESGKPVGNQYNQIKFVFEMSRKRGLAVKKCGVHPIYEQDLEEFNLTMDFATPKRSLALVHNDEEEPQPKRYKKFKFF